MRGLLLLMCLGRVLGQVAESESEVFGRKSPGFLKEQHPNAADIKLLRRIEEEMLALNKSADYERDKRSLGILLQGFIEALGYTVSPIQIASLPNPTMAAAQMPAAAAVPAPPATPMMLQQGPMTMGPPQGPPAPAPAAPAPRQRETLRFTGILNFGNHSNASNIVDHLSRYERLFHGANGTTAAPPAPAPNIDPRSRPLLPEPLFVKIPLPIVPNLPPPQPPSPQPIRNTYHDGQYGTGYSEEYQGKQEEAGHRGSYEEESEKEQQAEEYESSQEERDEPEERIYQHRTAHETSREEPREKNSEREYKKNENIVNYSVEKKELHDPSEVSEEAPLVGSKFNHTMYAGEPHWKQEHEDHMYRLALEQEAHAEALAEENAERERDRSREHESEEESARFNRKREKEISDRNEERADNYHSGENNYEEEEEEEEDRGSAEKEGYSRDRDEDDEEDYEGEARPNASPSEQSPATTSSEKEATKAPNRAHEEETGKPEAQTEAQTENYRASTLPINYDREKSDEAQGTLRDSYGHSLESPSGKVDERVADYISMFKNPETGVYDPNRIEQYENSRVPHDHLDLLNGFKRIQQEYGNPESKYEEYEINENEEEDESRSENYAKKDSRAEDREEEKNEGESRKSAKRLPAAEAHTTECDCGKAKVEAQPEEARTAKKLATTTPSVKITEAPTGYGPYYSTVQQNYPPLDNDQGIIARLTSYSPPTTTRYSTGANPSIPSSVPPTRLPTKTLLSEAEAKEIRTWPTPFDYTYDNSVRRDVVHAAAAPPATTRPSRPNCFEEEYENNADRMNKLLQQSDEDDFNLRFRSFHSKRRPLKTQGSGRTPPYQSPRSSYYPPPLATQATSLDIQKLRPGAERKSLQGAQSLPKLSGRARILPSADPSKNPTSSIRSENRGSRNRPTVRRKIADSKGAASPTDKSPTYVEKNGVLVIPEPTPYYYDERIAELEEELPKSNKENVKIKEYRNRVATVKVSELKKLHPEASTQTFGYTRHL